MIEPRYYSIRDAAKILGVKSRKTMMTLLDKGILDGIKLNGAWKIDARSISYDRFDELAELAEEE